MSTNNVTDALFDNKTDEDGNPAGGFWKSMGLRVMWQDGTLGRGSERKEPNGAFVEDLIAASLIRLRWYQKTKFHCIENAIAIGHLNAALEVLEERTRGRDDRGVEGTHVE